jgi:hypothetical protein
MEAANFSTQRQRLSLISLGMGFFAGCRYLRVAYPGSQAAACGTLAVVSALASYLLLREEHPQLMERTGLSARLGLFSAGLLGSVACVTIHGVGALCLLGVDAGSEIVQARFEEFAAPGFILVPMMLGAEQAALYLDSLLLPSDAEAHRL